MFLSQWLSWLVILCREKKEEEDCSEKAQIGEEPPFQADSQDQNFHPQSQRYKPFSESEIQFILKCINSLHDT